MSKTYLSLDIRDHSITGILVKSGLKGNALEGYAHVAVEAVEDSGSELQAPYYKAIAAIVEELKATGATCLVTIPSAWVSFRNLRIPFKDSRKIRQVLPFEIEPLLPFPLDEMILDFQAVQQSETSDIIAAAIEKAKLQPIMEAFNAFRISPQVIMPGGFPVALCLAREKKEESFLYVDMDETTITLFAVVSERVYLVRSIYTGHISEQQRLQTLKTNLLRFLAAFENIYAFDFHPASAFFGGDGLNHEAAAEVFEDSLNVSAEPIRIAEIEAFNFQKVSDQELPEFANNPIGLIGVDLYRIASLNFFREHHALYRYWEEYKSDIVRTGIIAALVLIIGMYGLIFQARHLSQKVNRVDRQIAMIFQSTFPDVSRIVDPLQQMQVKVSQAKGQNVFAGTLNDEVLNIEILNDLSRLIPSSIDVVMTRFVRGGGSVLISGHTDTFNAVDDIKGALNRSEHFGEITISSANMDKSTNRVQFKLKLELAESTDSFE